MDPNTMLQLIRLELKLADEATSLARKNVHRERAIEHFTNLDSWLSTGGFPPFTWAGVAPPAQRTRCTEPRVDDATHPREMPDPDDELRFFEHQRQVAENTREPRWKSPARTSPQCWESTLAGTQIPVPCPPPGDTVDDISGLLEPDPWHGSGAYDDPAVQRAIAEHVQREA